MEKSDRLKLKSILEEKIKETVTDIKDLEEKTKPIKLDNAIGRVTRMDAIAGKGVSETALNNARLLLKKLELALSRADDPEFGVCEVCSQPIPIGRIMLVPEGTTCVGCLGD